MKKIIETINHHTSTRNFKDEPLSAATKQQLITAAHAGSSSNFVQATSIIEVTDSQVKNELAELSNSAAYIKTTGAFFVFVADLYRQAQLLTQNNQPLAAIENMEALLVSVIDTAIAGENMAVAAESLDLGICFIGGIRNDLFRVRDLLNLPPYTVPLFGLTVGIPTHQNAVKPRLPQTNTVFTNQYDTTAAAALTQYDDITTDYYAHRETNNQVTNWSQKMQHFFAKPQRPEVADFIRQQGFKP